MAFLTVDRRGRNTLPEQVRRDLGIADQETSFVLLEKTSRGTYELVPASLIPNDQLWFHNAEMQDRVAQAESDFREGRSTLAAGPEEAQAFLDGLKKE
ncbi:MAG TPA: AbrB/MazE/SpoVT family DNA-binding domain-containing protein [Longimicrobium sp.]|jgi:bifunctional DNA-binding transcriptional regulator/antitoxin component of YhaV-PrlF toxin-antitoxin module